MMVGEIRGRESVVLGNGSRAGQMVAKLAGLARAETAEAMAVEKGARTPPPLPPPLPQPLLLVLVRSGLLSLLRRVHRCCQPVPLASRSQYELVAAHRSGTFIRLECAKCLRGDADIVWRSWSSVLMFDCDFRQHGLDF